MKATIVALCLVATAAQAGTFTIVGSFTNSPVTFSVATNDTLQLVYGYLINSGTLTLTKDGRTFLFTSGDMAATRLPCVVGPATVALTVATNNGQTLSAFCTFNLTKADSGGSLPSTAVVIPSDSNGPVNIILESSTDLLNWTPALPGTYGTTEPRRFFRVRAER